MLSRKGFISTQPARICPQLWGDETLQLCMGLLSARGTGKVADPIPVGCACPGDTSQTPWPRLPPTPLLQRSVWSQPSPPRYLTAFGADLLSAGPGWLRPQRGPPHAGMGGLRWLPAGCEGPPRAPSAWGEDGDGHSTRLHRPSIYPFRLCSCCGGIVVSRSGSVRGSAGGSGTRRWLLRSPSWLLNRLPKNGDRQGDRGACPQASGHRTAQAWREGLDVAQISWKGSASGSSAPFGRGVGGWTAGRGGPRPPPHGSGGALVGPAILRAL